MTHRLLDVTDETWVEIGNISEGVFKPLNGFLCKDDYENVVSHMQLCSGEPWTIPISLDVPPESAEKLSSGDQLELVNQRGDTIAVVAVAEVFEVDYEVSIPAVYGTKNQAHPGVAKELKRSRFRVGGKVELRIPFPFEHAEHVYSPAQTKEIFRARGWKTVVGFQTRNPIHRAHEYLQQIGLQIADGLYSNPIIGWKKKGDFTPAAVIGAYQKQIAEFFPENKALLGALVTPMRYAGPREAVFHAIIRKNFGCTHFIVGRDHAGVGNYYGKYESQKLCRDTPNLGISILALAGPYYCTKCAAIVTENICPHLHQHALHVSGTQIRQLLKDGQRPPAEIMRPEIADVLIHKQEQDDLFVR